MLFISLRFFAGRSHGDHFLQADRGVWMSRSSLVWGPFNIVWGFGCSILTALLYRCRNKSDRYIFLYRTVLGGFYEYACSVISERLFGTVFWDYSIFSLNLEGRINHDRLTHPEPDNALEEYLDTHFDDERMAKI